MQEFKRTNCANACQCTENKTGIKQLLIDFAIDLTTTSNAIAMTDMDNCTTRICDEWDTEK